MPRSLNNSNLTFDLTNSIVRSDDHLACHAGSFGDVYKCKYRSGSGLKEVAVKALRLIKIKLEEDKGTGGDELVNRELEIWRRLRHRNVVPFLGTATGFGQFGSVALVSLWMAHGTLQTFIDRYDGDLAIAHRFELLVDIASGLLYLHSFSITHGDLNSNNVLIDETFTARLADFGYASVVGEVEENMSYLQASKQRPGEWKWTAPERLFGDSEPTPRSDIYSFGNIVLQVLSGEQPWKNKPEAVVVLQLFQGVNPCRPQSRPIEDEHWEFIGRCWLPVQERPAAEDIVPELQRFLDTSHPHLPIREHLVVSPHDHSQPASTGTSNLEGARRDPSAPADISIVQCLPNPPQLIVSPTSDARIKQQTENTGHSPAGNLASFMGRSSALSPSLDSDIDNCGTPQISTLTETVTLISQCPDLTRDRWMQCTSDNVTPQPLADVASDPTVEPEEVVNEDQPRVKLTGFRVFIEDIHLHDPPKIGWSPLGGNFYVKISLDGQVQKTSLTGIRRMPWTKKITYDGAHDAAILTVQVFAHRILHKDVHLGTIEGKLALFMGRSGAVHPLSDSHRDHSGNTMISFSIRAMTEVSQHTPNEAMRQPVSISEVTSDPAISRILSDAECFAPFLEKIKVFTSLVEGFAEIHPYAKAAWFILSGVVQVVAARKLLNQTVKVLVEAMDDAYGFVSEANALKSIESNRKIISAMSEHTAECARLIEEIANSNGLAAAVLAPVMEARAQTYIAQFERHKMSLQQRANIQTAVLVRELSAQSRLRSMRCTKHVDYRSVPSRDTLAPHLADIVDDVTSWVKRNTGERVYFLVGPESSGKTSVARRVSQDFDTLNRLGSSYFIREPDHANNIYRTISCDIAERDAAFKNTLCDVIMEQDHLGNTSDVATQFTELILAPSRKMSTSTPTLVVIDALNNRGNEMSRVLEMLANKSMELPNNFRVLVTARPETDIVHAFQHKEHVLTKTIGP